MSTSPDFTFTGTTQNLLGSTDVAVVKWSLKGYAPAVPTISGTCVVTEPDGEVTCTGGTFSIGPLFGNDQISPSGTYYVIQYFSSAGELIASVPYSFTGSGTFDASTYSPITTPVAAKAAATSGLITSFTVNAGVAFTASVTNPNGPNTILNLTAVNNGSFISEGFGNGTNGQLVTTTLQGSGGGPANPQTIVGYFQVQWGGVTYWLPAMQ